jgi:uncharacterized protein (UPF0128 family)
MPGLDLKTEVELFKKRLEKIIFDINFYNERIVLKQILFCAQDLVKYHIEYIDDFLKETEDLENLTIIQRERAKTLLKPFQGLNKIEQMLNQVRENSAGDPAPSWYQSQ